MSIVYHICILFNSVLNILCLFVLRLLLIIFDEKRKNSGLDRPFQKLLRKIFWHVLIFFLAQSFTVAGPAGGRAGGQAANGRAEAGGYGAVGGRPVTYWHFAGVHDQRGHRDH